MTFRDGRRVLFPDCYRPKTYAQCAATDLSDSEGRHIQLKKDTARNLQQLISPSGRTINFNYDSQNRITEAWDDAGNRRRYMYDPTGHLGLVTDGSKTLSRFYYEPLLRERGYDSYLMTFIEDGDGKVLLKNEFADRARVSRQEFADGTVIRYEYLYDRKHDMVETNITFARRQSSALFVQG